jgi:uncharacterized protein (DUF1015 family)
VTAARAERTRRTDLVRPFESRVVRQEWADRAVAPMVDARGLTEQTDRSEVPDDEAYQASPRAYYVYRMRDAAGDHVGVVADVRLDAFADGGVRGHESVDPQRVDALVHYYADHPGRAEPVALLHDQPAGAARRVADVLCGAPLLQLVAPDGVEHTVWQVTGDETEALAEALGQGVHYVADGHHRVAARLRAWELAGRPDDAGVLCVVFPMDGLTLSAFHRRVWGPVDAAGLLAAAAGHFDVRPVAGAGAAEDIGLYVEGCWYDLALTGPRPEASAGLDAFVLQDRLLGPVLDVSGQGHRWSTRRLAATRTAVRSSCSSRPRCRPSPGSPTSVRSCRRRRRTSPRSPTPGSS